MSNQRPAGIDTRMDRKHTIGLFSLFALSAILRVALALLNRQSNDDHMEVVHWILQKGSLPTQMDCWECFQPKLYHFTVATLLRGLSITAPDAQIVVAQLLNVLASMVMLWVIWLLIRRVEFAGDTLKVFAFGLFALNPGLVGINIQATNDTFAIAFSVLALYFAVRMLDNKEFRASELVLTILFTALAMVSKTNAIVTALAIFCTLLLKAFLERDFSLQIKHGFLPRAALFAVLVSILVVFNPLSQYIENYQHYGSPVTLTINIPVQPLPRLFEKTETYKAGILSIQDGFFTFKWLDLMQTPQVSTENKNYPDSRTSFWTILYGRTYFLRYVAYPSSWLTNQPEVFLVARLIYLLALLPTLALLLGLAQELLRMFMVVLRPRASTKPPLGAGLFLITLLGYLAFLILYTLQYRLYSVIKVIFIYPALPGMVLFYLAGAEMLERLAGHRKWIQTAFHLATGLLLGLFVLDAASLIIQLAFFRPG